MPSAFFLSLMNGDAWGGSEELWYRTALCALKKGWKVSCAVYDWPAKKEKLSALQKAGASVYLLPNKGVEKKTFFQKLQFKITKKIFLHRTVRSLPFSKHDIVLINLGEFENTHSVWKDLYRQLPVFILLFHNYREGQILKPDKARIMQAWLTHARLNLFASGRIIEVLQSNSEIKITNADILLNPISFAAPATACPLPSADQGNYRFVMLAALDVRRKAQDNLIRSLSTEKWKQRNWTLHFYGEGKDQEKLDELIKANGVENKIFLEGHTGDVKSVLQNAHLLFQLTHIDAMPLSVVEAMAIGRPVAVTNIGDMPYWVNEGENGWISKDASVEQIDSTLEKAWQQKEQWPRMGANAFAFFRKKFTGSPEEKLLERMETVMK